MKYSTIGLNNADLEGMVEYIIENGDFEQDVDDLLNEHEIEICGIVFRGADIFRTDRIAYRELLIEYADSSREHIASLLSCMNQDGETQEIYDIEVTYEED